MDCQTHIECVILHDHNMKLEFLKCLIHSISMKQNKTSLPIYFKIDIRSKIKYFTLPTSWMIIAEWLYYSKFSRNN